MKQRIEIEVIIPDLLKAGQFKSLFRKVIEIDDSVDFDYKSVLKGLKCLFADDLVVICFKIG